MDRVEEMKRGDENVPMNEKTKQNKTERKGERNSEVTGTHQQPNEIRYDVT